MRYADERNVGPSIWGIYGKRKGTLGRVEMFVPCGHGRRTVISDKMVATRGKAWVETVGEDMTGYIRLSSYLCGDDTWEDTLKHEYAHLLAGVDAQHGELWVDACRQVGCSIETDGNEMPHKEMRLRYKYTCECKVHYRARRIKFSQDAIVICMSCKTPLKDANINTCYMNLGMDELPYIPTYIQGVL